MGFATVLQFQLVLSMARNLSLKVGNTNEVTVGTVRKARSVMSLAREIFFWFGDAAGDAKTEIEREPSGKRQ